MSNLFCLILWDNFFYFMANTFFFLSKYVYPKTLMIIKLYCAAKTDHLKTALCLFYNLALFIEIHNLRCLFKTLLLCIYKDYNKTFNFPLSIYGSLSSDEIEIFIFQC